jgi:uncharacterized protein (TIGR03067 family)
MVLVGGLLMAADSPKDDAVKNDRKLMKGTWTVKMYEVDGNKLTEDDTKNMRLILDGDNYTLKNEDTPISKGTTKIDPNKKPKTIDITPTEGDNQGQVMKGIYEIKEGEQKVCWGPPDKDRPTKFSSEGGYNLVIFTKAKKP